MDRNGRGMCKDVEVPAVSDNLRLRSKWYVYICNCSAIVRFYHVVRISVLVLIRKLFVFVIGVLPVLCYHFAEISGARRSCV